MRIFHYDEQTGVFGGEDVADPSPLQPGVWLIPAYATTAQPPLLKTGERAVWKDGAWGTEPIPVLKDDTAQPIEEPTDAI